MNVTSHVTIVIVSSFEWRSLHDDFVQRFQFYDVDGGGAGTFLLVFPQVTGIKIRLTTVRTTVRLLACMTTDMSLQVCRHCEPASTNITTVRFDTGVSFTVVVTRTMINERFVTKFTLEWFLPGVNPGVNFEIIRSLETFPAFLTFIRFLTGVGDHVFDQDILPRESPPTNLTLKLLHAGMDAGVFTALCIGGEALATNVTTKRFFASVGGGVGLQVT